MSAAAQLPADEGVSGSSSIAVGGEGAASASASGSAVEVLEPEAEAAPAMGKMGMCSRCDKEAAARYRCPGCEVVTCSLACTNEHKAALGCTGKRARTAFVDIHSLGDRHLISVRPAVKRSRRHARRGRRLGRPGRSGTVPDACKPPRGSPTPPDTSLCGAPDWVGVAIDGTTSSVESAPGRHRTHSSAHRHALTGKWTAQGRVSTDGAERGGGGWCVYDRLSVP